MARSIQQLRKDLETIENKVEVISQEAEKTCQEYMSILSAVVAKNFILAAYQVCTQIYPEAFLQLSYSQREKLQQKLKETSDYDFQKLWQNIVEVESDYTGKNPETIQEILEEWEISIKNQLEEQSKQGNHLLQDAGIIPSAIPKKILDMAIDSEEGIPGINSNQNLLHLLIESQAEETEEAPGVAKITVIRLRLGDLEFSHSQLNNQRGQIRKITEQINQLAEQYAKQKQELAIAEAETAWRASWHG